MLAVISVFPPNGLDRTLHVAVLVGLAIGTLFTEMFGWTYAGLVVPGYLATVFIAAPWTGAFIVVESVATYFFVALMGRWVAPTGAWSAAFGRERFYLFIVGAVIVRLAFEGAVVPVISTEVPSFTHSRELYSIGLVLVPLIANAFWNTGIVAAAPRVGVITALTFVVLLGLLHTTNLSVSRFQVINESLSLKFLESPKAQIILVLGALLGARNNVRYGWDYNGILVPGLLAVACYEPLKLLTTTVEALIVYAACVALTSIRPFSRMLIVGPRRMLFCYIVGFCVKMALGFGLARYWPGVPMIDYFGFGYLLPSLLAVKMWNKSHIGIVIVPTLQVSVTAFLIGNVLGYALIATGFLAQPSSAVPNLAREVRVGTHVPFALILGDTAPRPGAHRDASAHARAVEVALRAAAEVSERDLISDDTRAQADAESVSLAREERDERPWWVVTPRAIDPDDDVAAPRFAVRQPQAAAGGWMILVSPPSVGSPLPALAYQVAQVADARAIVLLSRHEPLRRKDAAFAERLRRELGVAEVLVIESRPGASAQVTVVGALPPGLNLTRLEQELGTEVRLSWRPTSRIEGIEDAPRLTISTQLADAAGSAMLGEAPLERWTGGLRSALSERLSALTSVGRSGYFVPSIEEVRLFDAVVGEAMVFSPADEGPSAWQRALAGRLGYSFVRVDGKGGEIEAWGVAELSPERRGMASWFVRPKRSKAAPLEPEDILIEVPAPRWEIGTFGAGLSLYNAFDARGLLVAGALVNADPFGASDPRRRPSRQSFFHRIHELWLGGQGNGVSVQGIAPERDYEKDLVISFGFEVLRPEDQVPEWARPLVAAFEDVDLSVGLFDGARQNAPYSGSIDLAMSYARRFAQNQFALVYLSSGVRSSFARIETDPILDGRLARMGVVVHPKDVAQRAVELAACPMGTAHTSKLPAGKPEGCPAVSPTRCDLEAQLRLFETYAAERNPFDLRAAIRASSGCHVEIDHDLVSGRVWAVVAAARGEPDRPHVEVGLMPLGGARIGEKPRVLASLPRVRQAVSLAMTSIRVVAP